MCVLKQVPMQPRNVSTKKQTLKNPNRPSTRQLRNEETNESSGSVKEYPIERVMEPMKSLLSALKMLQLKTYHHPVG